MTDDIETIYDTDWINGFNCEAMGYIGRDKAGTFYYSFAISPQDDEAEFHWYGPVETQEEARKGMNHMIDNWQKGDDERWQDWEDHQIEEFEREDKPQPSVKED